MANIQVTTLSDVVDATDGVTSLREAITQANAATGADEITFAASLSGGTIALTGTFLQISDTVTINGDIDGNGGPDITVSAAGITNTANARSFYISAGTGTLNGLTITGGHLGTSFAGGGVAVDSGGSLKMTNSVVTGNTAGGGGGIASLGTGTTIIDHTEISNNSATDAGTGGGGLLVRSALTLLNSNVFGNQSSFQGGGIENDVTGFRVYNSAIYDNTAAGLGGGVNSFGTATLINTTLSGNSAREGGGIRTIGGKLSNVAISGNSASQIGGGLYSVGDNTIVSNSIIAGNANANGASAAGSDVQGGVISQGVNVFSQAGVGGITETDLTKIFDQVAANPSTGVMSGVLADNGGPDRTIKISSTGVALNAGLNSALEPDDRFDLDHDHITSEPLPVDARGFTRVQGGTVDIGAYEVQPQQAQNDAFVIAENALLSGNVFADNGNGPDTAAGPFAVMSVNGVAMNVGTTVTLASGAKVTLNANGSLSYNPNHAFDSLPDFATSGASNTTATDSFTYAITGGSTATVTLTIRGVDSNDTLAGTTGADTLNGGIGNDVIDGGAGDDILDGGAAKDHLTGGDGSDTYIVDNAGDVLTETNPTASGGVDLVQSAVNWTLGANFENLTLVGTAAKGTGNGLDNVITGNGKNNTLNGGVGADTMFGGAGNDVYYADNSGDIAREDSTLGVDDGGIDYVYSSASFALGAFLENLTLNGTAAVDGTGNDLDNKINGNDAVNHLYGGAGSDILKGKGGADFLDGGEGGDYYYIDRTDTITDTGTTGTDTVLAGNATTTLATGDGIENLSASPTSTGDINLTGNEENNRIQGNLGANYIRGFDGNDFITAGAGNDTLVGGAGKDTLLGGDGADTFLFKTNDSPSGATSYDTINDFVSGTDKIDLDVVGAGGLAASAFGQTSIASNSYNAALAAAQSVMGDALHKAVFVAGTTDGWLFWNNDSNPTTADAAVRILGGHSLTAVQRTDII